MNQNKDSIKKKKSQPQKEAKVDIESKSLTKTNVSNKKVSAVSAKLRFLHMSPKKVKLVGDLVRGMKAIEAIDYLKIVNKAAATPIIKLINSAVANATNNFELEKNNLYIKNIIVNQGPTLKRWQPRAHGRATPIRKRSSHLEVILLEKKNKKDTDKTKNKKSKSKTFNFKQVQNSNNQKIKK